MAKNVKIVTKKESYTDEKNQKIEYDAFYLDIFGVNVKIKPNDATGKNLILAYMSQQ